MTGQKKQTTKQPGVLSRMFLGEERDFFLENMSALLASGIPITDAIAAVNSEIHSRRLKKLIFQMASDIDSGKSFSVAVRDTGLFSSHVSSLIRIGEQTGSLVQNLKIIANEQARERALRSKIRSAAMYPIFVFGLTLIIGVGIAWFILPKLATVFSQLNVKLPFITKILIDLGTFLGVHGWYAIPVFFVGIVLCAYVLFSFSKTKILGEQILFIFPGVKRLVQEIEVARFGYLLGTLIVAGLSPTEALDSLVRAASFARYRELYKFLRDAIADGVSFKKGFAEYQDINQVLPVPVQQLIIAGEQSGTLSKTLLAIGEDYEAKAELATKDLSIILEPILLVLVWLGVVAVALAIILPIYSLIGGLQVSPS